MSAVQENLNAAVFTPDQKQEIKEGMKAGLNVSLYAKPELLAIQMREIRLGLMKNLPAERYASSDYDWLQMQEIRKGLEKGLPVEKYANPSIPFDTMRQIRYGLWDGNDLSAEKHLPAGILREMRKAVKENVDISRYIKLGYEQEQLSQIRIALKHKVDIDRYLSVHYRGASIREIRLGLEEKVDVSLYAKRDYSWQQMREIRLGQLLRLDVGVYLNPFYSWQQMREIRLGLEENLPVEVYSSLMYTAREMQKLRLVLCSGETQGTAQTDNYQNFSLMISADGMEAFVLLDEKGKEIKQEQLLLALKDQGVVVGLDYFAIGQVCQGKAESDMVVIAHGKEAGKGADGWYEYFFETDVKRTPKVLSDGSVDYQNIEWFSIAHRGQRVAVYHPAEAGTVGYKVNGEVVSAQKGKEQAVLVGSGFTLLPDQVTYVAEVDGKIDLEGNRLEITSVLILDDVNLVTGNIDFNGSVYVRGTVGAGVAIRAEKDILVDGFIEEAILEAGGDIIIKKGNNAGGKGYLKAGHDVRGMFFENAHVIAGGDIWANYCLNSELHAGNMIEISGQVGMLAGGRAYATKCIRAYNIGNKAGIGTELALGKREQFVKEELALLEREKTVNQELLLLKNAYFDFQTKFTPEQRNSNPIYIKLEDAVYTKELEMGKLYKKREQMEREKEKFEEAKVIVDGSIFPGVRVDINGVVWYGTQARNVTLQKQGERIAACSNY